MKDAIVMDYAILMEPGTKPVFVHLIAATVCVVSSTHQYHQKFVNY